MEKKTWIIGIVLLAVLAIAGFYIFSIQNNHPQQTYDECVKQVLEDAQKYKPAREEPIGATRTDRDGNTWTKVNISSFNGDGTWQTDTKAYNQLGGKTSWGDILIDEQPGGSNYKVENFSQCLKYVITGHSKIIQPNQTCNKQNGYCYYNNIPTGMLYADPKINIPENLSVNRQVTIEEYFKRITIPGQTLDEAFGLDPDKYICSNGDKIIVIEYFYDLCEGSSPGMAGCGYYRKAYICGDVYFIEQYHDWTGPVLYGPFNLK